MKMHGYITTSKKYHYILLTEKSKISTYLLFAMARKMAETENVPPEAAIAELQNRKARAYLRKQIDTCSFEIVKNEFPCYNIVVGKPESPHSWLHIPLEDKRVIVFGEASGKPAPITYIIRDKEAGNTIASFTSCCDAMLELQKYEEEDKRDGNFTDDFYEIVLSIL